jgi:hypothetical protein
MNRSETTNPPQTRSEASSLGPPAVDQRVPTLVPLDEGRFQ